MKTPRQKTGFTLAELAIVLLIIGLILSASLIPVSRMFQQSQINATQERLDAAREALLSFATINSRLPCPDRTGDGLEDQRGDVDPAAWGCANNIYEGFLPWATLGVQQGDYWGIRFRYRVSAEFTRAGNNNKWICGPVGGQSLAGTAAPGCTPALNGSLPPGCVSSLNNPNSCTFEIGDNGDIGIREGQLPGSATIMNPLTGAGAVAVVLSHGGNGLGGTATDGTVRALPAASTDEALNAPALATISTGPRLPAAPFIIRTPTEASGGCADNGGTVLCTFDDQLVFIGANTLISRLAQAGVRLQ